MVVTEKEMLTGLIIGLSVHGVCANLEEGESSERRFTDMFETIRFKLNGKPTQRTVDGERRLLWVLRSDFGLTGTKYGCGEGICGACTVLINNKPTRSCQVPVKGIKGKEVTTIEGLARDGKLHPLQKAFMDHDALQCGFCTPGMIMNAYGLLLKKHQPTEAEIIEGMNDHLCRCGSHVRIVQAIQSAAKEVKGGRRG
jgi:aerobic-type carbon monoxide dehydrogenase small subunit (CoxS/CutS family)